MIRRLAIASIVGQLLWVAIAIVGGLLEPGYSEIRDAVSVLGAREMASELSWQHYAHGLTYFLGAIALLLSVFAMAWSLHGDERWGRFDLFALAAGSGGLLVFGLSARGRDSVSAAHQGSSGGGFQGGG